MPSEPAHVSDTPGAAEGGKRAGDAGPRFAVGAEFEAALGFKAGCDDFAKG